MNGLKKYLKYDKETGKLHYLIAPSQRNSVGDEAGSISWSGYRVIRLKGFRYRSHRVIWFMVNGSWPKGQIDHINGDRLDNRIENLRDVPHVKNQKNMKVARNNSSGFTGVSLCFTAGKWKAQTGSRSNYKFLGRYNELSEAVKARVEAELREGYHKNHRAR